MVLCLSRAIDLVSPRLSDHHHQVAYTAHALAGELGMPREERHDLLLAGALHDVGALSLDERLGALSFESGPESVAPHARVGAAIVGGFGPFARLAHLIRHHHTRWNGSGTEIPAGGHVLHLADRAVVLIRRDAPILLQAPDIVQTIQAESGQMFSPVVVSAFRALAARESFWLDVTSPYLVSILERSAARGAHDLGIDEILDLCLLFSKIIDFKSPFTCSHSRGVAALAEALAEAFGFSARENLLMRAAGYLHDIGKLAVPSSILDKPGRLTAEERAVVSSHTYHTYHVLRTVHALRPLSEWAALHHERLDGTGYPFRLTADDLTLKARIMAVADVFTALSEERPYRRALGQAETMAIMRRMAAGGALDARVVEEVANRYEELDARRVRDQASAAWEYRELSASVPVQKVPG